MSVKQKDRRTEHPQVLKALGSRIKEVRASRGMTQFNLAEKLDLSVAYVSLIERGGRNPPYTTVVAIARALDVSPNKLVAEA